MVGHGWTTAYATPGSVAYPPPPNAAGSVAARSRLIDNVNRLRVQLEESIMMSLPYLEPFETELNYLLYPPGGHYIRHLDIPRKIDSGWKLQGRAAAEGGSFCAGLHLLLAMRAPGTLVLTLLFAIVAMMSALQLGAAPARPAVASVQVEASSSQQLFVNLALDDELDNDAVPTDETLTPARGCKGCFG